MSGAAIQVVGLAELNVALERMVGSLNYATRRATATASHLVERQIKLTLSTSSHARGTPTPSAPGEPPSLVTGTLRRSITVKGPHPFGLGRWESHIGPTVIYGRIQELGGVTGRGGSTVLPARPYVQPSFDRLVATGALTRIYHSAWRAAIARH
jgi:phage gpG-like protein